MSNQISIDKIKEELESFLENFNEYARYIRNTEKINEKERYEHLDKLRVKLQRNEPIITKYLMDILDNQIFHSESYGKELTVSLQYLLANALSSTNARPLVFVDYMGSVTGALNAAIGNLEHDLWPRKEPTPVLIIKDDDLRGRCSDLLSAPGYYDRIIREVTTVLEDRMRNKCPHEVVSRLIPHSCDQIGVKLVNTLFNPKKPVLSISDDEKIREGLHDILLGTISYLRNPSHHKLDPATEWSWSWSTVGLVDKLLADIDSCTVLT